MYCGQTYSPNYFFFVETTDGADPSHPFGSMTFQSHLAQIGISVEPLTQLAQQIPNTFATTTSVEPFLEFSRKMLESFFNYASSFAVTQAKMTPNPEETYVPLSTLQNWFTNFQRRLEQNLYFWRSWETVNTDLNIRTSDFYNKRLFIFFLFPHQIMLQYHNSIHTCIEKICCGYSIKVPHQGAFYKYPQHNVLMEK